MINAAIVGLGWWGRTLVESAEKSDAIRFVAGASRTVTPEIETFAKQKGLRLAANDQALLTMPTSMRWFWQRRIPSMRRR